MGQTALSVCVSVLMENSLEKFQPCFCHCLFKLDQKKDNGSYILNDCFKSLLYLSKEVGRHSSEEFPFV